MFSSFNDLAPVPVRPVHRWPYSRSTDTVLALCNILFFPKWFSLYLFIILFFLYSTCQHYFIYCPCIITQILHAKINNSTHVRFFFFYFTYIYLLCSFLFIYYFHLCTYVDKKTFIVSDYHPLWPHKLFHVCFSLLFLIF